MKVVQTVHAKFHHFDLARQLHRHGLLEAIFTGYPRWKLKNENLPPEKIRTFPWLRTLLMAKWRLGISNPKLDRELNWWAALSLDAYVKSNLPDCDIFIGISGSGLNTARSVKMRGGRYICDRGSTHIRFAERILSEEFERWGEKLPQIDPRAIEREEQEYQAADAISVPSEFCIRSFVEMGVPVNKLHKIRYGVDLAQFHKFTDPSANRFEVLFVGQVSFRKGVPYLLEGFERLKHPHKRLRLVGAIENEMKSFLRFRHFQNVEFVGPVPQRDLVPIMNSSHVIVLPSIEDGFGMVLSQAMACGCPVICSVNTAGDDLIQDGCEGFVVPIRNAQALAERLEQLCDQPELRDEMGQNALRRVQELGGWDDYGNQFAELCRSLHRNDTQGFHNSAILAAN
jgi:glycosyltransferase involved in cell wall biosynthesis